jgi:hypothetical protein
MMPAALNPLRNAEPKSASSGVRMLTNTTIGSAPCCARAVSG